ncbi:MAG: hypothetical protein ACLFPA_02820 [Dichotomicrobium sp.]
MLRCLPVLAVSFATMLTVATITPGAAKTCFPVSSEVVSLGKDNARAYAGRRLEEAVAARQDSIVASGQRVSEVKSRELTCEPYANLIGADEWQCAGHARVCAGD